MQKSSTKGPDTIDALLVENKNLKAQAVTLSVEVEDLTKKLLSSYITESECLNLVLHSLASKYPTS